MFKPKYPTPDTYKPSLEASTPAAPLVQPTSSAPAPAPTAPGNGLAALVQRSPGTAVLVVAGGIGGTLALAAVAVSLLLAVAVTAIALAASGVVLLFLVRTVRDELHR
ncbi:SpdD protein [Streptomyces sp. NBC_00322]|uniref:SpdD protein n=1 Tax=Streptomyces sp. NBC_00322 TaxID=2975712 RepID=UPI002E2DF37E|nr:SpdD protein [Streptomyces sp. NBC_00322]